MLNRNQRQQRLRLHAYLEFTATRDTHFLKRDELRRFCAYYFGMTGLNLGLPTAWVVKCKKCGCTINCRAIDPQIEHSQPDKADPPPHDSVIVTCSCCWTAYRYSPAEIFKGAPGPSSNCYDRKKPNNQEERKPNAALLIAASLMNTSKLRQPPP